MKWFKHISDSLDDPFIFELIDKFGSDGYMVFFGTLEIISREFDIKTPGICSVPHRFLTKKLQLSHHKVIKVLKFCDESGRIFMTENGSRLTLNCPKLKDLCDEWTRKQLRSKSEVTPPKLRLEEEVEEEEPPTPNDPSQDFDLFWAAYPKKVKRGLCLDIWNNPKKRKNRPGIDKVLESVERAKQSKEWLAEDGKYIPHPSAWLNQGRWDDEYGKPESRLIS